MSDKKTYPVYFEVILEVDAESINEAVITATLAMPESLKYKITKINCFGTIED